MNSNGSYKIRPAGRHLLTIGKDLIQDPYAAVIELVKNAYDADSKDILIEFLGRADSNTYKIIIADHGHGMSRDTVLHRWMVPSTKDKLERKHSPSGRVMQGEKGIGRYAASILGKDLLLETITSQGEKTTLLIEWRTFETADYLDEVEVLIETTKTSERSGTRLTITGDETNFSEWGSKQFENLRSELKKLMPISKSAAKNADQDTFWIRLKIENFPSIQDIDEKIEPYPLFDLFDYRIAGEVLTDGTGTFVYSQQNARNIADEKIIWKDQSPTGCGELRFDIRVYDKDTPAIEALIKRGLKKDSGDYIGKLEAKNLLKTYNAIGVYRNGFRIRPLGDPGFDWLKLDNRRVQTPSLYLGNDQVIGYVHIQSAEKSNLIEKSARDGLREDAAYSQLKIITHKVISELERRRFSYRAKTGLGRSKKKIEQELKDLFSFDTLQKDVTTRLLKANTEHKIIAEIQEIFDRESNEKSKTLEEINQKIAIYQGQATLGKIINVVLHEGRRPLNYFKNQIPNLRHYHKKFLETQDQNRLKEIMTATEGIGENADSFVKLFGKLDPLAAGKRPARKGWHLRKLIQGSFDIFSEEIKKQNVSVKISCPDDFLFHCWKQDIYTIFINLIENSLYWMHEKKIQKREISVNVILDEGILSYIDYRDTGPGIEKKHIDENIIFEPQFTTKTEGMGLGLPIAGEASERNGLDLKVFEADQGAYFRIQPKTEDLK